MIFDEAVFSPGGDRYIRVEFGNEMNLELNFMAQGLAGALAESGTKGLVETAPCFATLLVHYEPREISYGDMVIELKSLIASLGSSDEIEIDSRLFTFETLYLDPWTKECIDDYREKLNPDKEYDPDFVARLNGLEDHHQLVRVHSSTEYWVASLGFWPGLPFLQPLDPRAMITCPIQPSAHLDATRHGGNGRLSFSNLSGGNARRLSVVWPHADSDLGYHQAL